MSGEAAYYPAELNKALNGGLVQARVAGAPGRRDLASASSSACGGCGYCGRSECGECSLLCVWRYGKGDYDDPPAPDPPLPPLQPLPLSAEQAAAAKLPATDLSVVRAPAGAGKTKTMVARAEHLCSAGTSCMLLVFARKAAEELRRRLRARWLRPCRGPQHLGRRDTRGGWWRASRRLSGVEVLTLHKWALSLLRRRMTLLRVLPEAEAKALTVVAASKVAPRPPQVKDGDILALLQRAERRPATIPPDDWLLRVREVFDRLCTSAGAVLLGAVFRLAAELLQRDGRLLAEVQSEVRHVLVDEAQDLDAAQLALLERLRAGSSPVGITAVGDPRQAIFGWRGAAPGTVQALEERAQSTQRLGASPERGRSPRAHSALLSSRLRLHAQGSTIARRTRSLRSPTRCSARRKSRR